MKINETVPTAEKLEIRTGDVATLKIAAKPATPGYVCKACGKILAGRADESACEGAGPHAPVLADLATAVVDERGRCVRVVHLE